MNVIVDSLILMLYIRFTSWAYFCINSKEEIISIKYHRYFNIEQYVEWEKKEEEEGGRGGIK